MNDQVKRLAIVGCGSSGLVALKYAIDQLRGWQIECFEATNSVRGCWGNARPGFVSTSTKYTTQFACFPKYSATIAPDRSYGEFFKGDEYGQYLEEFANEFQLPNHIRLNTRVRRIRRLPNDQWSLDISSGNQEIFDAVVLCTGLAARTKPFQSTVETFNPTPEKPIQAIRGRTIVVIGGGESGVDTAAQLAEPELENSVYLSLRSGVRVSPRYHPIRGVPSDYLRNRLMLDLDYRLRNRIGNSFVRARIKYREFFSKVFREPRMTVQANEKKVAKAWDLKLTAAANGSVFDVFHNKSDAFLDRVGTGHIKIIGPAVDDHHTRFWTFQRDAQVKPNADIIVPSIGFESKSSNFFDGEIAISDFFMGCVHDHWPHLYAIGFARPIIGNIPSISEMQARWITSILAGKVHLPDNLPVENQRDKTWLKDRFPALDREHVYPVEQFEYCDRLARLLRCRPNFDSWRTWRRIMCGPASTLHYRTSIDNTQAPADAPCYLPNSLILALLALRPISWLLKLVRQCPAES